MRFQVAILIVFAMSAWALPVDKKTRSPLFTRLSEKNSDRRAHMEAMMQLSQWQHATDPEIKMGPVSYDMWLLGQVPKLWVCLG